MAGPLQMARHWIAHHAQADERELHLGSIVSIGRSPFCAKDARTINMRREWMVRERLARHGAVVEKPTILRAARLNSAAPHVRICGRSVANIVKSRIVE